MRINESICQRERAGYQAATLSVSCRAVKNVLRRGIGGAGSRALGRRPWKGGFLVLTLNRPTNKQVRRRRRYWSGECKNICVNPSDGKITPNGGFFNGKARKTTEQVT